MGRIRSTNSASQAGDPYALPAEVDALLHNWGRWAAVREGRVQRRASGQWSRALRGGHPDGVQAGGPGTVDVDAAWRVERAICGQAFSPRLRTLLVEHYAHQRDQRDTCRDLGIYWAWYEIELYKAAMACWFRLQTKNSAESAGGSD